MELKKKISEEPKAIDPQKSIHDESVVNVPPPPHRSSRISHPPKRYIGMLKENVEEAFLVRDGAMIMILVLLMRHYLTLISKNG